MASSVGPTTNKKFTIFTTNTGENIKQKTYLLAKSEKPNFKNICPASSNYKLLDKVAKFL